MKIKLFIAVVTAVCLFSCKKYLDKTPDEDLTLKDVFASRLHTQAFLTSMYAGQTWEINPVDPWARSPWTGGSDEMEITFPGSYIHNMNRGGWNAQNILDNWQFAYQTIRKADLFLENIDQLPLQEGYTQENKNNWIGEAHFIRAYDHFMIFRLYGPMPIMDKSKNPDDDFKLIKRSPVDSCVDFIVKECEAAAGLLPITRTSDQLGRATRAAALALKARVLLYAASPLFNGNPDFRNFRNTDGGALFPQAYDAGKWKRAADAAKECIDACTAAGYGLYTAPSNDPLENYTNLFLQNNNKEVLWASNHQAYQHLERCSSPLSYGGFSIMSVSQQLVDAYRDTLGRDVITGYNTDGSPVINTETGYTENGFAAKAYKYWPAGVSNMYVAREPRFYASVHYSGALWKGTAIQTYFSGKDGASKNTTDFSKTGYVLRKFANPLINIQTNTGWDLKTFILFRLGEQYLNYAEALNESQGPVSDVYTYVNAIRKRGGIPDLPQGLSKEEMRKQIWQERRIELAFEGHRYFDSRRWKIAVQTNNGNLYGLNIGAGSSQQDAAFYKRAVADKRIFVAPRDYFWPVPQPELDKDPNLLQSMYW
ncbi:RagB/SusD family nutrient uptake outer membrane protein [Niabella pedocola]|uniref:RagB/SusD family nutrient uptake outer membrane protein n=1 Tax=Niabella pedocola TaxID=1752077 RepID=A0ABS8PWV9_9BACT|nr:RagB/SusD family nutrient uptake outer membrane protein [Niabella pedocola]MCD2425380.1 RagB/SusD family nutrient uptake outer membrane protein [Niabella pedocola]